MAESLTTEYADSTDHLKLFFPEGEIDFVASPNLTRPGFEMATVERREIRIETAIEIIAKKMWHRGNEAKARDLFDLCVVIDRSRDKLGAASEFLLRNRSGFLRQITERQSILRTQFDEIDVLDYRRTFDECVELACEYLVGLDAMPQQRQPPA